MIMRHATLAASTKEGYVMCTIMVAMDGNRVLVGRNFDWLQCGARVDVLPPERNYGGMTQRHLVVEQRGEDAPYEGINGCGVFVAMTSSVPIECRTTSAVSFDALGVMKFLLERAASAAEAAVILESVHLAYVGDDATNYLIADAAGDAFMYQQGVGRIPCGLADGRLWVVRSGMTVDHLHREQDSLFAQECALFRRTRDMRLMCKSFAGHDTAWSSVYDLQGRELSLFIEQNYDVPFSFPLDQLCAKGRHSYDFGHLKLERLGTRDELAAYTYRICDPDMAASG
jgi:hypothetical protein